MATQVLYRKWRPQSFVEVVGQEPVIRTLREGIKQDRTAHAYLFCGPRGTGKTSTARILAKSLNCKAINQDGEPDNSCQFCLAVNEGRALDLIEMDAASHRGIDDVRGLQEKVFGSGPADGRCKVYIIDEAHMLTDYAFNALLKTLEEPAPWAYFILCTTEAHKIPATIISRCQRFDFTRVSPNAIETRLTTICEQEGFSWEPTALSSVARASTGSLRDACNILEQTAIAYGNQISSAAVEALLGTSRGPWAIQIVEHTLRSQLPQGIAVINDAAANGIELASLHREIMDTLRSILLAKSGVSDLPSLPPESQQSVKELAESTHIDRLTQSLVAFSKVDLKSNHGLSTIPLDIALIESLHDTPITQTVSEDMSPHPIQSPNSLGTAPVESSSSHYPTPMIPNHLVSSSESAGQDPIVDHPDSESSTLNDAGTLSSVTDNKWSNLCNALKRVRGKKFILGSLLLDCKSYSIENDTLILSFRNPANRDRLQEELDHPPARQAFDEAATSALGQLYKVSLQVLPNSRDSAAPQGHLIRAAMSMGAKIVSEETRYEETS